MTQHPPRIHPDRAREVNLRYELDRAIEAAETHGDTSALRRWMSTWELVSRMTGEDHLRVSRAYSKANERHRRST